MDAEQIVGTEPKSLRRREWLIASVAAGIAVLHTGSRAAAADKPTRAELISTSKGMFRVRAILELSGEIRLKNQATQAVAKNGKPLPAKTAPIKSNSTIDFDEQFEVAKSLDRCRSYQYFHEATSEIQVDRHQTKTVLRESCHDIVKLGNGSRMLTACATTPLFAAERDLIEGPVSTMFIDQILPNREVRVTDKWTLDEAVACRLLNFDAIQAGKVAVCLVDMDDDQAHLEIEGTLSASVEEVATSMKLTGKCVVERRYNYVSWFAVNIEETREIGEAAPGFQVQAQLRVLRAPIDSMTSEQTLAAAMKQVKSMEALNLIQFQSDLGYYRFLADRKWSTYRDNGEESTLRYVDGNQIVAQCNITNLIDFEPGTQLSLEGFQADVTRTLANATSEILETSERLTTSKLRMLKIVISGIVQGVDIRWIHYHLSNDAGRTAIATFMLNESNLEAFGDQDTQLIGSFELMAWPSKLDAKSIEAAESELKKSAAQSSANSVLKQSEPEPAKVKSSMLRQPTKSR